MAHDMQSLLSQVAAEYDRVKLQNEYLLQVTCTCGAADGRGRIGRMSDSTAQPIVENMLGSMRTAAETPQACSNAATFPLWAAACDSAPEIVRPVPKVDNLISKREAVDCSETSSRVQDWLGDEAAGITKMENEIERLEGDIDQNDTAPERHVRFQVEPRIDTGCSTDQVDDKSRSGSTLVVEACPTTSQETDHSMTHVAEHAILHEIWQSSRPRHQIQKLDCGTHLSLASKGSGASGLGATSYELSLRQMQSLQSGVARAVSNSKRAGDAVKTDSLFQLIILRPNCLVRTIWDVLTAFMILFDVCVIPLQVFGIKGPTVVILTELYTTMFWTCDLVASFFVGYHHNGYVEMRPRKIALRYVKGWFLPDVIMVSTDWFLLLSPFAPARFLSLLRIAKVMRVIRVLRALRLVRLVKGVLRMISRLDTFMLSDAVSAMFAVAKLICFVVVSAHFIACGWFAISKIPVVGGDSWVSHLKRNLEHDQIEANSYYLYTTALHWALTQYTPASMEVTPRNWVERVYAILVLLFGLLVFSSTISRITTSMSRLQEIRAKHLQHREQLQRYMSQQKTTLELNACIFSYLKYHRQQQRQRLHMADVNYLSILPESLRGELCLEVFAATVVAHPLFEAVAQLDEPCIIQLCKYVISEKFVTREERLFSKGDAAAHMWYVTHGSLRYDFGLEHKNVLKNLRQGMFVSEISFWLNWNFEGNTSAKTSSEVFEFEAAAFCKMAENSASHVELQKYAQMFMDRIRCSNPIPIWEVVFDNNACFETVRSVFDSCGKRQAVVQHSTMYTNIKRQLTSAFKRWMTDDSDETDENAQCE